MFRSIFRPGALSITLAAAAILMLTMGSRQSFGLFISPISASTGMGIATISFALAVETLTWGAIQPVAGAADRWGARPVLIAGILLMALACAATPFVRDGLD